MDSNLVSQLQQLGEIRRRKVEIEAQEEVLVRAVRGQMSEHGLKVVRSGEYEAKLVEQERLTIRPGDFMKAVTRKDLLRCMSINVTAAREVLGTEKIRRISDISVAVQLRIAAIEPSHLRQVAGSESADAR